MAKKKINSKAKGALGERELAEFLRNRGFSARRGQQFAGGTESPDVICDDLPEVHFECKRCEKTALYDWIEQAVRDAGYKIPVVAHRKNNEDWLGIMRLDDLLQIIMKACIYDNMDPPE